MESRTGSRLVLLICEDLKPYISYCCLSSIQGQNARIFIQKAILKTKAESEYFLSPILIVLPTLPMITHVPVKTMRK